MNNGVRPASLFPPRYPGLFTGLVGSAGPSVSDGAIEVSVLSHEIDRSNLHIEARHSLTLQAPAVSAGRSVAKGDITVATRNSSQLRRQVSKNGIKLACERLGLSKKTKFDSYGWYTYEKPMFTFTEACQNLEAMELSCDSTGDWWALLLTTEKLLAMRPSWQRNDGIDAFACLHALLKIPVARREEIVVQGRELFEKLCPSDFASAIKIINDQVTDVPEFVRGVTAFNLRAQTPSLKPCPPLSLTHIMAQAERAAGAGRADNLGVLRNLSGLSTAERTFALAACTDLLLLCGTQKLPTELSVAFAATKHLASRWPHIAHELRTTMGNATIYVPSRSGFGDARASTVTTLFHAFAIREENNEPPPPYPAEAPTQAEQASDGSAKQPS